RLGGRGVCGELRGRPSDGLWSTVPRVADLAAGPRLAHLPLELGDRRFQGRVEGVLRRLGTCDAGLALEGDLDALTDLRQTRVGLVQQHHVESRDRRRDLLDLR